MPAWTNPEDMTDEEFRASKGAAMARLMGFSAVLWTDGWDFEPVRRIEL